MKSIFYFLCIITQLSYVTLAQNAYTVEQAKQYAVEHNFQAVNAKLDQLSAEQTIKETRAMGLPQVNGTVDFQNFIDIPTQVAPAGAFGFPDYITDYLLTTSQLIGVPINFPDPSTQPEFTELQFGTKYNTSAGLTVNQLIFDGTYFYGLKAAKEYRKMASMQYDLSKQEIERSVEKAYYMVLIAKENTALLNKTLLLLEKNIQRNQSPTLKKDLPNNKVLTK